MAIEQSCIELIFEQQNELSIDDFNLWLASNYDELKAQHKLELMGSYEVAQEKYVGLYDKNASLDFYNEFYGQ